MHKQRTEHGVKEHGVSLTRSTAAGVWCEGFWGRGVTVITPYCSLPQYYTVLQSLRPLDEGSDLWVVHVRLLPVTA